MNDSEMFRDKKIQKQKDECLLQVFGIVDPNQCPTNLTKFRVLGTKEYWKLKHGFPFANQKIRRHMHYRVEGTTKFPTITTAAS